MPRKNEEIAPKLLNVERCMTSALSCIDEGNDSVTPSSRTNCLDRVNAPERVRNMREGKQPDRILGQPLIQERPIDGPFIPMDRNELQGSTRPPRGHLPWNQIGMVLHLGDQNDIAWPKMRVSPGACDQVDPFGGPACEDDRFAGR